jgi:hypothetical protein
MFVNEGCGKLRLYLINDTDNPVYFDDMEVKVFTQTRIVPL